MSDETKTYVRRAIRELKDDIDNKGVEIIVMALFALILAADEAWVDTKGLHLVRRDVVPQHSETPVPTTRKI